MCRIPRRLLVVRRQINKYNEAMNAHIHHTYYHLCRKQSESDRQQRWIVAQIKFQPEVISLRDLCFVGWRHCHGNSDKSFERHRRRAFAINFYLYDSEELFGGNVFASPGNARTHNAENLVSWPMLMGRYGLCARYFQRITCDFSWKLFQTTTRILWR